MKLLSCLIAFAFSTQALASIEVGYFMTQRNSFIFSAEDTEPAGLGVELTGKYSGESGKTSRLYPWGIEAAWYKAQYGGMGPFVRSRIAPAEYILRKGGSAAASYDLQLAMGHGWVGPSNGELSTSFEIGLLSRRFESSNQSYIPSSGLLGFFSGAQLAYKLSRLHIEAALIAFPLGSNGAWGKHRDSNSLRIRYTQSIEHDSPWRLWFEFYHLHRTFTNSSIGPSKSYFWSDVTLSLGVNYHFFN